MINCPACGYDKNPEGMEFCDACGSDLTTVTLTPDPNASKETEVITPPVEFSSPSNLPPTDVITDPGKTVMQEVPAPINHQDHEVNPVPYDVNQPTEVITPPGEFQPSPTVPTLVSKVPGAPIPEFQLDSTHVVFGMFDPDSGPVDIDLEEFPGSDTVSRRHAEIYQENGTWMIKDLGSTNGVFLKRVGDTMFRARITSPEVLNSGDEIAIAKIRFSIRMD